MPEVLFANLFTDTVGGREVYRAMPLMLGVLCILAIAYRYYSAFLAAKVAAFDDSRLTPAYQFEDGQNYVPTNRWVLFGHHFAAISGAGPLIGPVLAIQYGYLPGLLWLVIGVCLAGAVQDMMVMFLSVRSGGKSLAEIARRELGSKASIVISLAILFIVIIALAGLGFIVVKALGGEEAKLPAGMKIVLPEGQPIPEQKPLGTSQVRIDFPANCVIQYTAESPPTRRPEPFTLQMPPNAVWQTTADARNFVVLPANCKQLVKGSSWGTFTIACTIPIALFVGLWMYRIRKERIVEASLIGAVGVIAATIAGAYVPGSALEPYFSLDREETILALCIYGFIASVLPVWLLLGPRDYLSSFLKIGTLALMVVGVILANPAMHCPPLNRDMQTGGPTFEGNIFPFVFICIMCGAISGFHSLVASGTTPKMIAQESHIRSIGYGAMLMEGLVGLVALIAAASMPVKLYYDINVDLDKVPAYQKKLDEMYIKLGIDPASPHPSPQRIEGATDPLHQVGVRDLHQIQIHRSDLGQVEEMIGGESLRGRTGGAVTLAVSMAMILTDAFSWADRNLYDLMKYWYHFAIMFEALFILTTIDAGTRIARFLVQEMLGKVFPKFEQTDWLPGALLATGFVTAGWGILIHTGSIGTIWPMFGIANQLLAVVALALVTTWLINHGRARYAWVTLLPMLFVCTTTMTAANQMVLYSFPRMIEQGSVLRGWLNIGLTLFVVACVMTLLLMAVSHWLLIGLKGAARTEKP